MNYNKENLSRKYEIEITDMDSEGRGVGRLEDGRVVFVPYAYVGERVSVQIRTQKKSYAIAVLDEVIRPSEHRVTPICAAYSRCGGCSLQHIDYAAQLEYKRNKVKTQLGKIGEINDVEVTPCVQSPDEYNYRNKAVFRFERKDGRLKSGFFEEGTNRLVACDYCHICSKGINDAIEIIRNFLFKNNVKIAEAGAAGQARAKPNLKGSSKIKSEQKNALSRIESVQKSASSRIESVQKGFSPRIESVQNGVSSRIESGQKGFLSEIESVMIREIGGSIQVTFEASELFGLGVDELGRELARRFDSVGIYMTVSDLHGRDRRVKYLYGEERVVGEMFDLRFELSNEAFMQVNTGTAHNLYKAALSLVAAEGSLGESEEIIVDAYSGIGILTALFAKRALRAYGIEIVSEATAAANYLAKQNGIENVSAVTGDCSVVLPELLARIRTDYVGKGLTVVIDPPRRGCSSEVIDAILSSKPDRIIYISCDSATLARDLKGLKGEYEIRVVRLFDMFPQTSEVETLVYMVKKS